MQRTVPVRDQESLPDFHSFCPFLAMFGKLNYKVKEPRLARARTGLEGGIEVFVLQEKSDQSRAGVAGVLNSHSVNMEL